MTENTFPEGMCRILAYQRKTIDIFILAALAHFSLARSHKLQAFSGIKTNVQLASHMYIII